MGALAPLPWDGGLEVGAMRVDEVPVLVEWAASEQWNPGLADVDVAWQYDPAAFIAVRSGDELIAGGTVISYGGAFGFMGLFIVREDRRGVGLGRRLWHFRRDLLLSRLQPGSSIGMDGVFDMVPFYARGGFSLAYRDLRFEGIAVGESRNNVVDLVTVPFATVDAYDQRHVAASRSSFLRAWLAQPGVLGGAVVERDELIGYGVLRPCRVGYKFGPLFADRADVAEALVDHLMAQVPGEQVQLDVPEPNAAGLALVAARGMSESFGCARMYHGPDPGLPVGHVYGVTSFEFG
jgi:GNAT superfamily N-acetyltransferase